MVLFTVLIVTCASAAFLFHNLQKVSAFDDRFRDRDRATDFHALNMVERGRNTFRFDTFGDQDFWGGTLQLHQAIKGQKLGGVGPGVDPATALAVGLKVDEEALPPSVNFSFESLWTHNKGGFYHDGRFATLLDVVNHYDSFKSLHLSDQDKNDLVEYLKSL
jgi:hypothetical protein